MEKSTLYLNHFELARSPFRQEHELGVFFHGAGHTAILQAIVKDIEAGKPLTRLTGSEGVGKTLLNILVAEKISSDTYDTITIDNPAGSFDDLLRVVCRAMPEESREGSADVNILDAFREAVRRRKDEGRKVLLIIDNAEKIFLATLERLIKLICDVDDACLQVILIGRLELDNNLDQLKVYCSSVDIQTGYVLEPLDSEQTKAYLQYRLLVAGASVYKCKELFSDDASGAVYLAAQGNIRLTNNLAEKGLRKACAGGMFQVDAESIASRSRRRDVGKSFLVRAKSFLLQNKWWVAASGVLLFLLFILLNQGEDQTPQVEAPTDDLIIEEMAIDVPEVPEPEKKEMPSVADTGEPEQIAEVAPEMVSESEGEAATEPHQEEVVEVIEESGPLAIEQEKLAEVDIAEKVDKGLAAIEGPQVIEQEVISGPVDPVVLEPEAIIIKPIETVPKEPVAIQAGSKKILVAMDDPVVIQADGRKIKRPVQSEEQSPNHQSSSQKSSSVIFEERLKATPEWVKLSFHGGYAIQLMALTSEAAEQNFIQMLDQEEYIPIRDNLYIVRRNTPKALFVFYGKYDTLEDAKKGKDSLPPFLQAYEPYAISIREALRKIDE